MQKLRWYSPAALHVGLFVAAPAISLFLFAFADVNSTNLHESWRPSLANISSVFLDVINLAALMRSLELAVVTVSAETVLGVAIALMLDQIAVRRTIVVRLLAIPVFSSPLVIGVLWKLLFAERAGLVNGMLRAMSLGEVQWLSLTPIGASPLARWLNLDAGFAIVCIAEIWQWTPFVVLILVARLQTFPARLRDAAIIDGLTHGQFARAILLPFLRPTLTVVVLLRSVDALKVFDTVWALYGDSGGIATASVTVIRYALVIRDYGRAAVASLMLLVLATLVCGVIIAVNARRRVVRW